MQLVDPADMNPLYAPFQRRDQYGVAGLAPQPLVERARLFVMAITLLPLRLAAGLYCVAIYYIICRLATHLLPELPARRAIAFWGRIWCRLCLLALGFMSVKWIDVGDDNAQTAGKQRREQVRGTAGGPRAWQLHGVQFGLGGHGAVC